ncbi:ferrous iron transport protein B [Elusimicrobiota bacterium]
MKDAARIILVGVPNSGKSSLFNKLQAGYSLTGNYPHTTATIKASRIRVAGRRVEIVDTPGINSLRVFSEDGLEVRDILLKGDSDIVVQCVDASAIGRSLLLTSELLGLGVPLLICLNFMDEALAKGIRVDARSLERILKVPVLETVAHEGIGLADVLERHSEAGRNEDAVGFPPVVSKHLDELAESFTNEAPRGRLLTLLADPKASGLPGTARKRRTESWDEAERRLQALSRALRSSISAAVLDSRNLWVRGVVDRVVERNSPAGKAVSDTIGDLVRHPVWGWPVLAGVLLATFYLVGRLGAVHLAGWLDAALFTPLADAIGRAVTWPLLSEFLVGDYGILTMGLFTALGTVLPILSIFFVILAFLEDSGYISNLCVLTNNLLKKVGLSGRSVMPLILGFGCKTMATLMTKSIESWKERYIAVFLIAFAIPCSAQFGLTLAVLAHYPVSALLICVCFLAAADLIAGLALNRLIPADKGSDFFMEIPPIRTPRIRSVGYKVYWRLKEFVGDAVPLFVLGAAALFFMDKTGTLGMLRTACSPVVESFLSLPAETLDGFILCLVRQEQGIALLLDLAREGKLSYANAVVCVVVVTGFVPCIPNMAAMGRRIELGHTVAALVIITLAAVLMGGTINWLLRLAGGG